MSAKVFRAVLHHIGVVENLVFTIKYIICFRSLCVIMIDHRGSFNFLHVGCWNVGSFINMDGNVEIATVEPIQKPSNFYG